MDEHLKQGIETVCKQLSSPITEDATGLETFLRESENSRGDGIKRILRHRLRFALDIVSQALGVDLLIIAVDKQRGFRMETVMIRDATDTTLPSTLRQTDLANVWLRHQREAQQL